MSCCHYYGWFQSHTDLVGGDTGQRFLSHNVPFPTISTHAHTCTLDMLLPAHTIFSWALIKPDLLKSVLFLLLFFSLGKLVSGCCCCYYYYLLFLKAQHIAIAWVIVQKPVILLTFFFSSPQVLKFGLDWAKDTMMAMQSKSCKLTFQKSAIKLDIIVFIIIKSFDICKILSKYYNNEWLLAINYRIILAFALQYWVLCLTIREVRSTWESRICISIMYCEIPKTDIHAR